MLPLPKGQKRVGKSILSISPMIRHALKRAFPQRISTYGDGFFKSRRIGLSLSEDQPLPCAAAARDPAIEDELDLLGTAEVEVLADHLFKEQAAVHRPVEHLRGRELRLQDRDVVALAGLTVRRREGVRHPLDRQLHMMLDDLGYAACYHPPAPVVQVLPLAGV